MSFQGGNFFFFPFAVPPYPMNRAQNWRENLYGEFSPELLLQHSKSSGSFSEIFWDSTVVLEAKRMPSVVNM